MLKNEDNAPTNKPKGTAPDGLKKVEAKYGKAYAQLIEKAIRLETAHFTSGQWLKCGTAGMEASPRDNSVYPFGWGSLKRFSEANGFDSSDYFVRRFNDAHTGVPTNYVGFKETGVFIQYMAWFLKEVRGGNVYAWNSLNAATQAEYKRRVDKIVPKFIV